MKKEIIKYLGIDWGEKRIGLALGDNETGIATPHKVAGDINEIIKIVKDEEINVIIIGKPLSITDYRLQITDKKFNYFINELKKKIKVPVEFMDERLSSKAADALSGDEKPKAPRDAVAAMIILQSYLDKRM